MAEDRQLTLADSGEAADLAAFLGRQLRWDRTAAARLQVGAGVLAVFTQPARFGVLAVQPRRLRAGATAEASAGAAGAGDAGRAAGGAPATLDVTVSAGELLDGIDEGRQSVAVPAPVTGPAWAGLLPPRAGWTPLAEVPADAARAAAGAVVAEFRRRTERLPEPERTRAALDGLAEEVWSRRLPGTPLPLRAVHAAHALGFLRGEGPFAVLHRGPWLRLRTPVGSVALRHAGAQGLSVTPV